DPTSAELLSFRHGTVGAGLASWDGPGPDRIPPYAQVLPLDVNKASHSTHTDPTHRTVMMTLS
ncbi:hypothetical protein, partial [Streptomyces sp. NPDC058424]|uniref:hypothetical protein n=1 Tax=Streptomyces sp. NPDC058424 TaxID=3346491 RepID=UPI0036482086